MVGIRVSIDRYLSDEPQPGIVECHFLDARGCLHTFVEKTAVVSSEHLDATTHYPRPGEVGCEVVRRERDSEGREFVLVDTVRPWDIESSEGESRFEVMPESLAEWI